MDARELAYYITEFAGGEISPIKLQKSLYFCFAYWGGFVRKSKIAKSEIDLSHYSEKLFDNKIEAWVYGPVVPDVYHEKDDLEKYIKENEELFTDSYMQEFVNDVLKDVLACNDFTLVDTSHQDQCWKKHFKKNALFHNDEIPAEEIIKEYATSK